jgi:hypothetical protein
MRDVMRFMKVYRVEISNSININKRNNTDIKKR